MYQLLEYAGLYNQSTLAAFNTYGEAIQYRDMNYSKEEINDMELDITFNYSTEF